MKRLVAIRAVVLLVAGCATDRPMGAQYLDGAINRDLSVAPSADLSPGLMRDIAAPVDIAGPCPELTLSAGGGGAWQYRAPIKIDGSPAGQQADYVVMVKLDAATLIADGKLQASGADLRFLGGDCAELPFWLEGNVNAREARLWVKVKQIPVGGTTIHAFYGNPMAQLQGAFANNGKATFIAFDDFERGLLDGALWKDGENARWPAATQQGGGLHWYCPPVQIGGATGQDIQTVPTFSGSRVAEFAMTTSNMPNPGWKSSLWNMRVGPAGGLEVSPFASASSGWWSNGVANCAGVDGSYTGRIVVDSQAGAVRFSLGNTPCGNVMGVPLANPYVFYFTGQGDGTLTVDLWDFRVRPYVDPEPAFRSTGAEERTSVEG